MFKLQSDVETIDEVLKTIEVLATEARFDFNPDGLSIPVADEANVGKADIWIDSTAFDFYDVGKISVGISVEKLRTIVDLSNDDEDFLVEVYPQEQMLEISIDGQEFKIGLFDPDKIKKAPETPELDRPVNCTLSQSKFRRAMVSADAFADHIQFKSDNEWFEIMANGDVDSYRNKWTVDELTDFEPGNGEALYSLSYLTELAEAIPQESDISIEFGLDVPGVFSYNIANEDGVVEFVLAPRLEEDLS